MTKTDLFDTVEFDKRMKETYEFVPQYVVAFRRLDKYDAELQWGGRQVLLAAGFSSYAAAKEAAIKKREELMQVMRKAAEDYLCAYSEAKP